MDCARITSPEDFGDCRFGVGNILHPPYRPAISHCGGCTDSKARTGDPSAASKTADFSKRKGAFRYNPPSPWVHQDHNYTMPKTQETDLPAIKNNDYLINPKYRESQSNMAIKIEGEY
ncbi:hypothetical protein DSO57_1032449 [Entomophthora muscae]|uniref:Uncharacterized protein n=1 Tax=Entomophthora muscae TaxID=34485 RepID=A0ACC2S2H6_9FUNG|nr:hypothetical protein DSO57_1032449 [Entomophthora muscae]